MRSLMFCFQGINDSLRLNPGFKTFDCTMRLIVRFYTGTHFNSEKLKSRLEAVKKQ
jgi:hypothetical protein